MTETITPNFFKIIKRDDPTLKEGEVVVKKVDEETGKQLYGYISKDDPNGEKTFIGIDTSGEKIKSDIGAIVPATEEEVTKAKKTKR